MEEIDRGNVACAPTSFLLAHSRTDNIPDRQLPITAFEGARRLKCRASKKVLDKGYPHRSRYISFSYFFYCVSYSKMLLKIFF